MQEKFGFVYIWYDRKHKRYYIGCHWGTLDDGYISSSLWMKKSFKRRPEDFKRRILSQVKDRSMLHEEEYKWLSQIKTNELKVRYYNFHNHHFGHWTNDPDKSLSTREKMSKSMKEKYDSDPEYAKSRKDHMSQLGKRYGEESQFKPGRDTWNKGLKGVQTAWNKGKTGVDSHVYGRILPEESREKISKAHKGRQSPMLGKSQSEMTKIKIRESNTGKKRSEETKRLIKESKMGVRWWNNGFEVKRSRECPGNDWVIGRKINKSILSTQMPN